MANTRTRQAKRSPVTLKIKFKSETLDQFIERYAVDVSHGGIFIRTKDPLPVGTEMRFEFQLKNAQPLITGEGTVVWTREHDPKRSGVAPGMGVRFDRLAGGSQSVLDRILAQKSGPGGGQDASGSGGDRVFHDEPTRVAPTPLVAGLANETKLQTLPGQRPSRPDFSDNHTDATPLPPPTPFHSDADEFPDEAFEEATKVRSLDELALASAQLAGMAGYDDDDQDAFLNNAPTILDDSFDDAFPEPEPLANPIEMAKLARGLSEATLDVDLRAATLPDQPGHKRPPARAGTRPGIGVPGLAAEGLAGGLESGFPGGTEGAEDDRAPTAWTEEPVPEALPAPPTPSGGIPSVRPAGSRSGPPPVPVAPASSPPAALASSPAADVPSMPLDEPSRKSEAIAAAVPEWARGTSALLEERNAKPTAASPSAPVAAATTASASDTPDPPLPDAPAKRSSGAGIALAVVVVLLAALGGGGYYMFFMRKADTGGVAAPVDAAVVAAPVDAAAPEPTPVATVDVTVTSEPEGATAELIGTDRKGPTPMTFDGLDESAKHRVRVSKPGYVTQEVEINPEDDLEDGAKDGASVSVTLAEARRIIRVESTPEGARVYVNGRRIPELTPTVIPLDEPPFATTRRFKIAIRLPGHEKLDIVVERGELEFVTQGNDAIHLVEAELVKAERSVLRPTGDGGDRDGDSGDGDSGDGGDNGNGGDDSGNGDEVKPDGSGDTKPEGAGGTKPGDPGVSKPSDPPPPASTETPSSQP